MSKNKAIILVILLFVAAIGAGELLLYLFPDFPKKIISTEWGYYLITGILFLAAILKIAYLLPELKEMNSGQIKSELIVTGAIVALAFLWKDVLSWLSFPHI